MERLLFIFGRHPTLSLAELTAAFPQMVIVARGSEWIVTTGITKSEVDLRRVGGVVKFGVLGTEMDHMNFSALSKLLIDRHTSGKLTYGVSAYGARAGTTKTVLIGVKKELKNAGISARFVNKNFADLTSAQSSLAKLPEAGSELLVASNGKHFWVAQTVAVQPFDSYKSRDYEKTVRDAQIGMLPPKLAQMMINIAVGSKQCGTELSSCPAVQLPTIYDPFCGTGTVLAEAGLLGYPVVGSDLNPKMVEASIANLAHMQIPCEIFQHDATKILPLDKRQLVPDTSLIVTEGYLGPALFRAPPERVRQKICHELGELYTKFFAWAPAATVVITLPAYIENGIPKYFSSQLLAPIIANQGWQKINTTTLTYSRPDQVVGREIMVWQKKCINKM